MKKMRRAAALCLALCLALSLAGTCAAADVPWYEPGRQFVAEHGLAEELPGGYRAASNATRAEVLHTLYMLAGRPAPEGTAPFSDLDPAAWYAPAMNWSWQVGIVQGTGVGCDPTGLVDRAQLATMLERWLGAMDLYTLTGSLAGFVDAAEVPDWARTAMASCAAYQIVMGDDLGRLDPKGKVNWAQLGTVLLRLDSLTRGEVTTRTTLVDKFGTVSTALPMSTLTALGYEPGDMMVIRFGETELELPYVMKEYQVNGGTPAFLPNAGEMAALAMNMGGFSPFFGLTEGMSVTVGLASKADYAGTYALRDLEKACTTERKDYPSDTAFANFREVTAGAIPSGVLYRSANPVNLAQGDRRLTADSLLEKAGVKTIVNLADCRFQYRSYPGYEDTDYSRRNIVSLNMGADFLSDAFTEDMFNGLDYLTEQPGPYLIHGDLGVNRTGFVLMVLETLMGATKEELIADYMRSYEDLYHVKEGSEAWESLRNGCALYCLRLLTGAWNEKELDTIDLVGATKEYLINTVGLTPEQVGLLTEHLQGDYTTLANADPTVFEYTNSMELPELAE